MWTLSIPLVECEVLKLLWRCKIRLFPGKRLICPLIDSSIAQSITCQARRLHASPSLLSSYIRGFACATVRSLRRGFVTMHVVSLHAMYFNHAEINFPLSLCLQRVDVHGDRRIVISSYANGNAYVMRQADPSNLQEPCHVGWCPGLPRSAIRPRTCIMAAWRPPWVLSTSSTYHR